MKSEAKVVKQNLGMRMTPLPHVRAIATAWGTQRRLELFAHAEPNTSLARRAPATSQSSLQTITNRCMPLRPLRYISQKLA